MRTPFRVRTPQLTPPSATPLRLLPLTQRRALQAASLPRARRQAVAQDNINYPAFPTSVHNTASCRLFHQKTNQSKIQNRAFSNSTANMTSMPATSGHSAACCNVPPVVTKGYQAKGSYDDVGGFKTYATGPSDAQKGILVIMDIFGFFEQTLQGADILASNGAEKYRVVIPDWFEGEPAGISWYPPTDDDKKQKLGAFFGKHPPTRIAPLIPDYIKAASAKYPSIKSWAILGYCWGGKVATIATSTPDTPFTAAVSCHPAMIDPADGPNVKVPFCLIPSMDEDQEAVKAFSEGLTVKKHVETFPDQIHGFMAARADLEDEKVAKEYKKGYEVVLKFLGNCM